MKRQEDGASMIIRVWQGKLALWKTFWLFGAGGGILIGLSPAIAMLVGSSFLWPLWLGYLWPVWLGYLVPLWFGYLLPVLFWCFFPALGLLHYYLIWVSVGICRAAINYQGNPVWAVLAQLAVAAGTPIVPLLIALDIWIVLALSSRGI